MINFIKKTALILFGGLIHLTKTVCFFLVLTKERFITYFLTIPIN